MEILIMENHFYPIKIGVIFLFIVILSLNLLGCVYGTNSTFNPPENDKISKSSATEIANPNTRIELKKVRYWGYQLQDISKPMAVNKLANSRYDLLVVEPTRTDWSSDDKYFNTKKMVQILKNSKASDGVHRKIVLAYINIGEAEDWRWYWKWSRYWKKGTPRPRDWPSYILSPDPDGWTGNYPVAYWDRRWKDLVIYGHNQNSKPYGNYNSILNEAINDGFDGIYLDWVEGFEDSTVISAAKKQNKNATWEMIKFIKEMQQYALKKNPNFLIIQQNGAALGKYKQIFDLIDGISQEAIWYDGTSYSNWYDIKGYDIPQDHNLSKEYIYQLYQYKKAGIPVFNCEYAVNHISTAYQKSKSMGFIPYFSRRPLSKLTPIYSQNIKIKPPISGIYHGAFPDFGGTEDEVSINKIIAFERLTNKKLFWAAFSENWGTSGIKFPAKSVQAIYNLEIIPYIRLMPRSDFDSVHEKVYTLQHIIDGNFDVKLKKWARDSKTLGIPIMVDFACEMNGNWFPWSGVYNGGRVKTGYGNPYLYDGPERYRDAYQHIIKLFRKEGANQITFVFHPDAYSSPSQSWNSMSSYYPGDSYIDWIGMSAYGPQTINEPWESFSQIMEDSYHEMARISATKPLAILEYGATEKPGNNRKAEWIKNALLTLLSKKYNRIKAEAYWHENWLNSDGTRSRLRLDSSSATHHVYNYYIRNTFFVSRPRY
jgi:uncharacterized protein (TIGR01370 family)